MNFKIELKNFTDLYSLLHIDTIVGDNEIAQKEALNFIKFLREEIKVNHNDNEIINLTIYPDYEQVGINIPWQYLEHLFSCMPDFGFIVYINKDFKGFKLIEYEENFKNQSESFILIENKQYLFEKINILDKIFNLSIKEKILKNKIYSRKTIKIEEDIFLISYSSKNIFILDKINNLQIIIEKYDDSITILSEYLYSKYYFKNINYDFIYETIFSIYSSILNTEVNFDNIAENLELSKILNYS